MFFKDNSPTVSVIVITFNSSKYILDTLESIKCQSYQNIELIISDDGSNDETVKLCCEWGENNKDRFLGFMVIEAQTNIGIPGNCNQGLKHCRGEWLKFIAGDDVLIYNCLEEFIKFTKDREGNFYFSNFELIDEYGDELQDLNNSYLLNPTFYEKKSTRQFKDIIYEKYLIPAPTAFINRKALIALNGFDEEIPFCEDYPLWVRATKSGYTLQLINKKLVKYRIYQESVSKQKNNNYTDSLRKMFFKYRFKPLILYNPLFAIDMGIRYLFIQNSYILNVVKYFLPYTYINFIKRKLKNRYENPSHS